MAIWRITTSISGIGPGGPGVSVMHWEDPGADALDGALAQTAEFWDDMSGDMVSTAVINVGTDVVDVATFPPTDPPPYTPPPTITGDALGTPLPWATQLCVTWKTGIRSRSATGRTFIPGLTELVNDDGTPSTLFLGRANAAAVALYSDEGIIDLEFGVYSRKLETFFEVTSHLIQDKWAVLTSRRD